MKVKPSAVQTHIGMSSTRMSTSISSQWCAVGRVVSVIIGAEDSLLASAYWAFGDGVSGAFIRPNLTLSSCITVPRGDDVELVHI